MTKAGRSLCLGNQQWIRLHQSGIAEGPEHPVHSVNWYDCVKWANALSERDGHTPCYYTDNNCTQVYRTGEVDLTNYNVRWNVDGYRLPTESEWEVAPVVDWKEANMPGENLPPPARQIYDQSLHGPPCPLVPIHPLVMAFLK